MTAEDILKKHFVEECKAGMFLTPEDETKVYAAMIEFAKLHVEAALKAALEEVPYGGSDPVHYEDVVGILDCYPLTNIK